jgi:hypothetical protein
MTGEMRLPLRTREVLYADGTRARSLRVFCPTRDRSLDPRVCAECPRVQVLSADAVHCCPPASGAHASAGAYASDSLTCVRDDVRLPLVAAVIRADRRFVPVVDEALKFVGFIGSWQVQNAPIPVRLLIARDLAVASSLVFREGDSPEDVLRGMGRRRARVAALVDSRGTPSGTLTDVEVLRAVVAARQP